MKYSEIFRSIQGEGVHAGTPSAFLRTSYCNLRCVWCDTPYTSWHPENRDITTDDAFRELHAMAVHHVVITGGEPFIQADEVADLCDRLHAAGHYTTIETNGTVFAHVQADLISLSPKLSNSSPPKDVRAFRWHESKRVSPDAIRRFLDVYTCQVKFVVDRPEDLDEINEIVRAIPVPRDLVVLMPQGQTKDEVRTGLTWLGPLALESGYRLSPRLHVDIWGSRRGV